MDRRLFERVPGNAESPECYREGDFHPVRLGDTFKSQQDGTRRYRVVRKLGWGTCATVWLAKDNSTSGFVALKICAATGSRAKEEAEFLKSIRRLDDADNYCQQLLDEFEHVGPNGVHQILVLQPMGRSLENYLERLNSSHLENWHPFAREVSRQLVLGVQHIHEKGIVHRDLQPGNIMLRTTRVNSVSGDRIEQDVATDRDDIYLVRRLDGLPLDDRAPPYLVEPRPLEGGIVRQVPKIGDFTICITDFGAASSFEDVNDGNHAFPTRMRPPELVLGMPLTAPQADIWSLGCLIYQTVTMASLFYADGFSTKEEQDDEYLQSIVEVMGPLPIDMLSRWSRRADFVDAEGKLLQRVAEAGISEPLDELVNLYKPDGMDTKEMESFIGFLRMMLRFVPEERASASELLKHPWLSKSE
ncbi:serine/threonine-protein kinase SRPK3 [Phlyctema vagabunda]|uniref:non-specific serine/threonine protein kinase n=1 Tax=Phlyctema vagabunda TaxID=108571 RepID=A0ABR4P9G5_9HELO